MLKSLLIASALLATTALGAQPPKDAEERAEKTVNNEVHSVRLADVPANVRLQLRAEAKNGGRITELRRVKADDGSVVYKAEIIRGDLGTDIALDVKGNVIARGVTHSEKAEQKRDERK
jgi:hypothetical protein